MNGRAVAGKTPATYQSKLLRTSSPAKTVAVKSMKFVKCSPFNQTVRHLLRNLIENLVIVIHQLEHLVFSLFSNACISVFQASFVLLFKLVRHNSNENWHESSGAHEF